MRLVTAASVRPASNAMNLRALFQFSKRPAGEAAKFVEVIRHMSRDLGKSPSQPPDVAGDDNAMLGQDATYLIH